MKFGAVVMIVAIALLLALGWLGLGWLGLGEGSRAAQVAPAGPGLVRDEQAGAKGASLAPVLPRTGQEGAGEPISRAIQPSGLEPELAREAVPGMGLLSVRIKAGVRSSKDLEVSVVDGERLISPGSGRTDRRGRIRLEVEPGVDAQIVVLVGGAAGPVRQGVLTPAEGERKSVVIDLSRYLATPTLDVEVVSFPSGEPLGGASVQAMPRFERGEAPEAVRTDSSGLTEALWFDQGGYIVSAPGHGRVRIKAPQYSEARKLRIDLPKDAELYGRLALLVDGANSTGAELGVMVGDGRRELWSHKRLVAVDQLDRPGAELPAKGIPSGWSEAGFGPALTQTDRLGQWQIRRIQFRTCDDVERVSLEALVNGQVRLLAHKVEVRPGDRLEIADPLLDGPPLDLQLHYGRGADWRQALALVLVPSEPKVAWMRVPVTTDSSGRIRLAHLSSGTWDVHSGTTMRPLGSASGNLEPLTKLGTFTHGNGAPQQYTIEGWVPFRGQVTGIPSDRRSGIWVRSLVKGSHRSTQLDAQGRFDLSPVPVDLNVRVTVSLGKSFGAGSRSGIRVMDINGEEISMEVPPDWTQSDLSLEVTSTGEDLRINLRD
ncbi:MAG: hypothetical protein ACJA2W_003433 [Planctomycetota bacterium]|jgi:hypothetical protein